MVRIKRTDSIEEKEADAGLFFESEEALLGRECKEFTPSGCTVLDCALSGGRKNGGWAEDRVINVIGDKSSGKTVIAAVEFMINYRRKYPDACIDYIEPEYALDRAFATILGLNLRSVNFINDSDKNSVTLAEEYVRWITARIEYCLKKKIRGLILLDSVDALSDAVEMEKDIGEQDYARKPGVLSKFWRKHGEEIVKAHITLMCISQIRASMVKFGRKWTRSGGNALNFYASQMVLLAEKKKEVRTVLGEERVYAINIHAGLEKNKVYDPYRECNFPIHNRYGMDDIVASIEWFKKTKAIEYLQDINILKSKKKADAKEELKNLKRSQIHTFARKIDKNKDKELKDVISDYVKIRWNAIDEELRINEKYWY